MADYYLHKTAAHIDELLEKVEGLDNYDDTEVRGLINNKVDKETGKGLSTNDFTDAYKAELDGLDTALNGKVDKETGKGLSTNDYTTLEKTKLNGIEAGANVNVQADWSQTTTTADDYIKNKPTIPDAQIQSDWNQTNTESKDFIKNKPTLGSAASKNYTASITSDSNDLVTSGAVYSAVSTKADLVDGKVPAAQLPSYVDDVLEYDSLSAFPETGESGKIYISTDTNKTYRWSGTGYAEISESLALGETASTAYAGNKGKANADAIIAIKDGTTIDSFGDVETALSGKANSTDLAAVATSGSYNDLTNKPTLGTAAAKGVDTAPTASSTNLVESGGVRNVVDVLEQMNGAKNRVNINVSEVKSLNSAPWYTWNRNSCTVNGVTFTINNDNTITTSGATQSGNSAVFTLCDFGHDGTSEFYGNILSGCARGGNYSTSYSLYLVKPDGNTLINNDNYNGAGTEIPKTDLVRYLRILFRESTSADNLTFKPMICTKAAWDAGFTDFQPYALPVTTITPELIELVDSGAKNLSPVSTGTSSVASYIVESAANLPAGDYVFCWKNSVSSGVSTVINCYTSDNTRVVNENEANSAVETRFITIPQDCVKFKLYTTGANQVTDLMICTKAAWDVSQKHVPYVPSMAEMYEMIKALQT